MDRSVQPTSGAIRAANRGRIVAELRRRGCATRAELAQRTGLSRATVSSIVGDLLEAGLVEERPVPGVSSGRPPTALALNRRAGLAIAVDVGVRHVAVAVGDLSRSIIAERWTDLPPGHGPETGTRTVLDSIAETLRESGADETQLVGAAISIAAPVARDSGRLPVPGVLPGWNGTALATIVGDTWRIPVALENDANLGALGETVSRGLGRDSVVLYVKLASRIGLGIALGSRIFRGRDGYAGELGHVLVDPDGGPCWCGRSGCLELYAGGDGILRRLGDRAPDTLGELVARSRAGDPEVVALVGRAAELLARALADLALILDPSAILIGGELAALGEQVLTPVRATLAAAPFGVPAEVAVSPLGERASLLGALALVLSESDHFVDRSSPLVRPRAGDPASEASPWGRGAHLVTTEPPR